MSNKTKLEKPNMAATANEENEKILAYPHYPASEDIYNKFDKEFDIDPENIAKNKDILEIQNIQQRNVKDFNEDKSGNDLDIPGSELDDQQEEIGSEDEENNGYSIGGDNHNELEEDNEKI